MSILAKCRCRASFWCTANFCCKLITLVNFFTHARKNCSSESYIIFFRRILLLYKNTPTSSESFLILGCCPRFHYFCASFFSPFFIILLPPSRFVRPVSIFYSSPTTWSFFHIYIHPLCCPFLSPITHYHLVLHPALLNHFLLLLPFPLSAFIAFFRSLYSSLRINAARRTMPRSRYFFSPCPLSFVRMLSSPLFYRGQIYKISYDLAEMKIIPQCQLFYCEISQRWPLPL